MSSVLSDEDIVSTRLAARANSTKPWADTLAFGRAIEQAVASKLSANSGRLKPSVFRVEFEFQGRAQVITIELCRQRDGTELWAIRHTGNCFGAGDWEYEPTPSGRSDEFLVKYRHASLEAAQGQIDAAIDAFKRMYS